MGVIPKLRHPRHPLDTAPKGVETHPGDGRLSIGDTSKRLFTYIPRAASVSGQVSPDFQKEEQVLDPARDQNTPFHDTKLNGLEPAWPRRGLPRRPLRDFAHLSSRVTHESTHSGAFAISIPEGRRPRCESDVRPWLAKT